MTLPDANVLLYAYDTLSPHHAAALAWVRKILSGSDRVALALPVIWAFLRVGTNRRILANPIPAEEACRIIRELLDQPNVSLIEPGPRHLEILESLITKCNATGPLVSDAVLASLAIENGATLASTDRDFRRFENLRWINPLA